MGSRRGRLVGARAFAACALGLSFAVAACSLLVDTDGLTGGSAATKDGASSDGAADADGGDAALDGSPSRWCSTQSKHFLCDDFDDGEIDARAPWTGTDQKPPYATLAFDKSLFVSPPRALRAEVKNVDAAGGFYEVAGYGVTINKTLNRLLLDVDVYLASVDDDVQTATRIFELAFHPIDGTDGRSLTLSVKSGSTRFNEGGFDANGAKINQEIMVQTLAKGRWVRVGIHMTALQTTSPQLELTYDGATVRTAALAPGPVKGNGSVDLSIAGAYIHVPATVVFDNVTIDAD